MQLLPALLEVQQVTQEVQHYTINLEQDRSKSVAALVQKELQIKNVKQLQVYLLTIKKQN